MSEESWRRDRRDAEKLAAEIVERQTAALESIAVSLRLIETRSAVSLRMSETRSAGYGVHLTGPVRLTVEEPGE